MPPLASLEIPSEIEPVLTLMLPVFGGLALHLQRFV